MVSTCIYIGGACRSRVSKVLAHKFKSPIIAERYYMQKKDNLNKSMSTLNLDEHLQHESDVHSQDITEVRSQESTTSVTTSHSINIEVLDTLSKILEQLFTMDSEKQLHILNELLRKYFSKFQLSVPDDFLRTLFISE